MHEIMMQHMEALRDHIAKGHKGSAEAVVQHTD